MEMLTSFRNTSFDLLTLLSFLQRYSIRQGAIPITNAKGSMVRMDSSNVNVKSKLPRQFGPAHGPKVLSTRLQSIIDVDDIVKTEVQLPDPLGFARNIIRWELDGSRMFIIRY